MPTTAKKYRVTKKQSIARLTHLRTIMARVPEAQFNIDDWAKTEIENTCGTVACVLGWAGLDPTFNELGLYTHPSKFGGYVELQHKIVDDYGHSYAPCGGAAGRIFFGLTEKEMDCLFYGLFYGSGYPEWRRAPKPTDVIRYIDELIAARKPTRRAAPKTK